MLFRSLRRIARHDNQRRLPIPRGKNQGVPGARQAGRPGGAERQPPQGAAHGHQGHPGARNNQGRPQHLSQFLSQRRRDRQRSSSDQRKGQLFGAPRPPPEAAQSSPAGHYGKTDGAKALMPSPGRYPTRGSCSEASRLATICGQSGTLRCSIVPIASAVPAIQGRTSSSPWGSLYQSLHGVNGSDNHCSRQTPLPGTDWSD